MDARPGARRTRTLLASAAAAALAAFLVWWAFGARPGRSETNDRPEPLPEAAAATTAAKGHAPPAPASREAGRAAPRETAASAPLEAAPSEPGARSAEIRGRFLREDGAPAAGLAVELGAWPPSTVRELSARSRPAVPSLRRETPLDGRFAFRFIPDASLAYWVRASGLGLEAYEWRCEQLAAGETADLGEVTLRAGATVAGRLVDRSGRPLDADWSVAVRRIERGGRPWGPTGSTVKGAVDPRTGEFLIEGAPPGPAEVTARLFAAQRSPVLYVGKGPVTLTSGLVSRVELDFDGSALDSQIRVLVFALPSSEPIEMRHVTLRGDGIAPRHAEPARPSADGSRAEGYYFFDLPRGRFAVEVRHPDYEPFAQEDVEPGPVPVRASLQGNATLRIRVLGAAGEPVDRFGADLEYRVPSRFGAVRSRLRWESDPAVPAPWTIPMVPVTRLQLTVTRAEGVERAQVAVEALAPHETRDVTVRLERPGLGKAIAGWALAADGETPLAGEVIGIYAPANANDSDESPYVAPPVQVSNESRYRARVAEARADERGLFRTAPLPPGRYIARVARGAGIEAVAEVAWRSDEEPEEVRLVLPRGAFIEGRVRGL